MVFSFKTDPLPGSVTEKTRQRLRTLLLLLLLLMVVVPTQAQKTFRLKLSQSGALEKARVQALTNIRPKISTHVFKPTDPNFLPHAKARENRQTVLANASITSFEGGTYSVTRFGDTMSYYYTDKGALSKVGLNSRPYQKSGAYPYREIQYDYPTGNMINVALHLSRMEVYSFYPDGRLLVHCLKEACYQADGLLGFKRALIE